MASIEIDFEVFKALTSLRTSEETTYNAVVRNLLKLPAVAATASPTAATSKKAWTWKGMTLPHGTQLKAEYKGQAYTAEIQDGRWIQDGQEHGSPSAAGFAITNSGINGWRFWSARRPGDSGFTPLANLRPGSEGQKAA